MDVGKKAWLEIQALGTLVSELYTKDITMRVLNVYFEPFCVENFLGYSASYFSVLHILVT